MGIMRSLSAFALENLALVPLSVVHKTATATRVTGRRLAKTNKESWRKFSRNLLSLEPILSSLITLPIIVTEK